MIRNEFFRCHLFFYRIFLLSTGYHDKTKYRIDRPPQHQPISFLMTIIANAKAQES